MYIKLEVSMEEALQHLDVWQHYAITFARQLKEYRALAAADIDTDKMLADFAGWIAEVSKE